MPRLGKGQQSMRASAFELIVGFKPAIRLAASKARRKPNSSSISSSGKSASPVTSIFCRSRSIEGWRNRAAIPPIPAEGCRTVRPAFDGMEQILAEVDFSAFQQGQYLAAGSFPDPDLNLRVTFQHIAACQQLLAFAGQNKSASDAVEEPQTQFALEIDELS